MVNWGWQMVFYVSSMLGLAVAVAWNLASRTRAGKGTGFQRQQRRHTDGGPPPPVPWKRLASHRTLRWLVLGYSCLGYVAYVYMSWFYLYLINVRGFDDLRGGWFAAAPFLAILVSCPLGGWVTDHVAARHGLAAGRVWVGMAGMLLAGVAIAVGGQADSPALAIGALSAGAGCLYFTVGAYWASATDLSKTHAGTLSGIMNTGANLGGALSPTLTPWLADRWGWSVALGAAALMAIAGGIMWAWIDPAWKLDVDTGTAAGTAACRRKPNPAKFST
jgi:ACS family glucarate transporter-like MFS transporter